MNVAFEERLVGVFDTVDDLLNAGNFAKCCEVMNAIDIEHEEIDVLVCFLMATAPAPSSDLPCKPDFARKVQSRIVSELGETEAESLLAGLV